MEWAALLVLLFAATGAKPEELMKAEEERRAREKREKHMQYHCEHVEWEQDMHAMIPFCKLYGGFCEMQCMRR